MTVSADRLAESRRLARMLMLSAERVRADFASAAVPLELPLPLARALLVLTEPIPMRELAGHLACDPSYITSLADQLEALGLVVREPGRDRRVKLLVPTERGAAVRARLEQSLFEGSVLQQGLDAKERETLARLLERILGPDGMTGLLDPDHSNDHCPAGASTTPRASSRKEAP